MAKITWDAVGERFFETGIEKGVLYVYNSNTKQYGTGIAWNGLTAVNENPSGAEANDFWADNIKYLTMLSAEEFGATIEAYTYPDEFMECDGSAELTSGVVIGQQTRKMFGLSYVTRIGNDVDGQDHGYKIHLVYGCKASPSSKDYATINDSPEAITFSWEITTTPVAVKIDGVEYKPTAHLIIDSRKFTETAAKAKLTALENKLYGTDTEGQTQGTDPTLPLPATVVADLS